MNITEYQQSCEKWLEEQRNQELSTNTITTYRNALKQFQSYLESTGNQEVTRDAVLDYKNWMLSQREKDALKTNTINARLIALNKFLKAQGLKDYTVKTLKTQQRTIRDDVLTETDFNRLIRWADNLNMEREKWIMHVLASTGIRISELKYFTVENLKKAKRTGCITVRNKGKERTIILPDKIRLALLKYAKKNGIKSGVIFHGRTADKLLDKTVIFRNLKRIAGQARVKKDKVHPHSFRHIFAKRYLKARPGDTLTLADYLGHSSLTTTRIYTQQTGKEQKTNLNDVMNDYL